MYIKPLFNRLNLTIKTPKFYKYDKDIKCSDSLFLGCTDKIRAVFCKRKKEYKTVRLYSIFTSISAVKDDIQN